MKRLLLSLAFALAAIHAQAQEVHMDFIPFHYPGYELPQYENKILQQRNGELVANVLMMSPSGDNHIPPIIEGLCFYKVSPTALQFTDSLFVADTTPPSWYLFAQDPRGEGNLRVNIEPDSNGGTALRISHFPDNDLRINPDEDVVAHLFDSAAGDYIDSYMIDSQYDLILKFYTAKPNGGYLCHIARCGLDGTVKHLTTLPGNMNFLRAMEEFESTPKQYFQLTKNEGNLFIHVFDSTFHEDNSYVVNKQLYYAWYGEPFFTEVEEIFSFSLSNVIPDGGDVFIAAPFDYDSAWVYDYRETGVAVARYELRTMQRKALVHFNDYPGPTTDARIMCFQKSSYGDLYLVYWEPDPQHKNPSMTAVKMDRDLNVIWKRYCYELHELETEPDWSCYSDMLKDEYGNEIGVYIAGYSNREIEPYNGLFFFFLTDEGLDFVEEGSIEIRPYAYYPNPTQDQLRLQYSPDVKPARIELYDLQGRLVRSQSHGLESVEMQGLSAGQYLMKVTLEDGKSYTDKVVKE